MKALVKKERRPGIWLDSISELLDQIEGPLHSGGADLIRRGHVRPTDRPAALDYHSRVSPYFDQLPGLDQPFETRKASGRASIGQYLAPGCEMFPLGREIGLHAAVRSRWTRTSPQAMPRATLQARPLP